MCVCISLSAYVTLFCLFSPKLSIILLHPDKNVRKLTMNSATYKRPFKPVSSFASVDGRGNNLTGGTYNGTGAAQTDGGSGGPMSTTSNVLNLGGELPEEARQAAAGGCFGFSCSVNYTGTCFSPTLRQSLASCGPTCCLMSLRRWLAGCCAVGELGPGTSLELESTTGMGEQAAQSGYDDSNL